jgi:hypothetical protein
MTCKSGQPTHNGGRSLCTKESTSVTSNRPTDALMYSKVKMLRDKKFKYMEDTTVLTKDGRSFILTR